MSFFILKVEVKLVPANFQTRGLSHGLESLHYVHGANAVKFSLVMSLLIFSNSIINLDNIGFNSTRE